MQFSLSSLLWLTATVGLVLAYLRAFEAGETWRGLVAVGVGLLVGVCAAAITRRTADALYWSVLGSLAAFLCAVGYDVIHPAFHYGWMFVGAMAGGGSGVTAPGRPIRSMLVGGLGGGAVLGALALALPSVTSAALVEVGCAALAGALLGGVVEMVFWIELHRRIPRYITAAGLVFAVIAGNIAAKYLIPGGPSNGGYWRRSNLTPPHLQRRFCQDPNWGWIPPGRRNAHTLEPKIGPQAFQGFASLMDSSQLELEPHATTASALSSWYLMGQGESAARRIPLTATPFRVGRKREASLCLPSSSVSKDHAEFALTDDVWVVRDLGSTNGTFHNGRRIENPTPIHKGDVLHFANQEFHVGCSATSSSLATRMEDSAPFIHAACQFDKLFDEGNAVPYFQPIVSLTGAGLLGYEVLGRSLLDGLKSPREMFLIAARLKQEGELSRLFRTLGVNTGQSLSSVANLFLNTHPFELDDSQLLVSMQRLRSEAPSQPLTLEVHESAVTSPTQMRALRAALNDLDIRLAYDDFGSGQDRLLDLAEVPPDYLKFDARLIRDIHQASPGRRQMVGALVKLVRDLNIVPLAEGVESGDESEVCLALGFELAQGYFFGRPAPAAEHLAKS